MSEIKKYTVASLVLCTMTQCFVATATTTVTWPPVRNVVDNNINITKSVDLPKGITIIVSENVALTVTPTHHHRSIGSHDDGSSELILSDTASAGGINFDLSIHGLDFLQESDRSFKIKTTGNVSNGSVTFSIGLNQKLSFIPKTC